MDHNIEKAPKQQQRRKKPSNSQEKTHRKNR
jgi:hypothetical protein